MLINVFLPILSIFFLTLFIYLLLQNQKSNVTIREAYLITCIILGYFVILFTELISIPSLINKPIIICFWSVFLIFLIIYLSLHLKNKPYFRIKKDISMSSFEWFLIFLVFFILITIFITGFASAPNNYDSFTYHLGRVIHWIQNQSLFPYQTNIQRQLFQAPFAEIVILHFQILTDSDKFAFLVQFGSMIGSLIGVSLVTKEIGGTIRAQILSAFFCATIPMGILQASSTQNDYVVSFFLVCFLLFLIKFLKGRAEHYIILSGCSFGLAVLTKQTALIFGLPFLFITIVLIIYQEENIKNRLKKPISFMIQIGLLGFVVNLGQFLRNYQIYDDFLGRPFSSDGVTNNIYSFYGMILNAFRNIGHHLGYPGTNHPLTEDLLCKGAQLFRLNINDPNYTFGSYSFFIPPFNRYEDTAGNFFHLIIIFFVVFLIILNWKRERKYMPLYLLCIISGFLFFSFALNWQPWGSRLQLPLFILFTPLLGYYLSQCLSYKVITLIVITFFLISFPFLFINESRPIIGCYQKEEINNLSSNIAGISIFSQKCNKFKSETLQKGVILSSRTDDYFSKQSEYGKQILLLLNYIKRNNLTKIGLDISGDTIEYPYWAISRYEMNYPIHVEHVNVTNPSNVFRNEKFPIEVIISTRNLNEERFILENREFKREISLNNISLFRSF